MRDKNEGTYRGEGTTPVTTACKTSYELSWKGKGIIKKIKLTPFDAYTHTYRLYSLFVVVVVVVVVVVAFTLNRSFYPTTSAVPPVSFLILHPREIQILWSQQ